MQSSFLEGMALFVLKDLEGFLFYIKWQIFFLLLCDSYPAFRIHRASFGCIKLLVVLSHVAGHVEQNMQHTKVYL